MQEQVYRYDNENKDHKYDDDPYEGVDAFASIVYCFFTF